MGRLCDGLNKLFSTKQAIRAAIEAQGVEVTDLDPFASYADKIASVRTAPAIPDYSYTGDHLTRIALYNGVPYAEWELRTSGTFSFASALTIDIMLVGGGGQSAATNGNDSSYLGPGGSAFYLVSKSIEHVVSCAVVIGSGGGDTTLTIGQAVYTGQKGGRGSGTTGGTGYIGEYRLFNEPGAQYVQGIGKSGTNGGSSPGTAGDGCLLSMQRAGGSVRLDSTTVVTQGGVGYGAGEGSARNTQIYPIAYHGTRGNPGVALIRVALS